MTSVSELKVRVNPPMILTLKLNKTAQAVFNTLRKKHFPVAINYLDAHLTLFHDLPIDEPVIQNTLKESAKRDMFDMKVTLPRHTGFGVSYGIESPELMQIVQVFREKFMPWLIPQDKQKFQPHITIQNKVTAELSKELAGGLQKNFNPFTITATGFSCFIYHNGPWKHLKDYNFLASFL